ncbi:autotransporter outer membrane beta-barrel domain-containing protein [Pasteurella dagmatis]|uniref:Outer membrane autotransporter barrel domain protein n=1 Tax=Pasteurella dagmatis ATCC 43325 TaxID=667128 RepID=C9PRG0_9PAST|nr:autotransporter outer membrane beta-barrel domain-containing protein [Pasteurella dagmatis]EEX50061.1 outer membrane autotransporter barrel domain protein [Pasteurella dagmatis ATCC 43325]SNV62105.1 protein YdeU [Pasteurella dagmatis]
MKLSKLSFKRTSISTLIGVILFNLPLSAPAFIDEKINEAISNIKKLEAATEYNKIEVKNTPSSFGLNEDDKGFVTFNVHYNADRNYAVYSNHNPHTVRVLNKVHLESWAEVLTSRHGHHIKHLYFVENEGKILGTANNANAMTIYAPNVYLHNKKTGDIVGETYTPLVMLNLYENPENSVVVLDNEGSISTLKADPVAYISGKNIFMINREGAIIKSPTTYAFYLYAINTTYFKNAGKIEGKSKNEITSPELYGENSGIIDNGLSLNADKGDFFNTGIIKNDLSLAKTSNAAELFTLHLQNGTVEGDVNIADRQARTKVVINSKSNITGNINAHGPDDILKLLERGSLSDPNKFKGFEHLALEGDWVLDDAELQFTKSVIMEKGTLRLNGGQLNSQRIFNSTEADIITNKDYLFNGSLINEGRLLFLSDNKSHHTLTVSDDYQGSGKIVMRVNVGTEPLKHDKLIINNQATGSTAVEIVNPDSTLEKQMKGKAKLIETQGSSENAFYLVQNKFGSYKYYLSPMSENNQVNWYLYQLKLIRNEIGNLASSISAGQQLFAFSYYDRLGATKIEHKDRLWTRMFYNRHKNGLINSDIKTTSNSYGLQIGYDFGDVIFNDKQWKYGTYINLGMDNARSQSASDDEQAKSKLKGYGAGLYASLEHSNWYVDSWLGYNHFKTRVTSPESRINYSMNAFQTSIEAGYQYILPHNWTLQPQFQIIYSHLSKPSFSEYKLDGRKNLTTRMGVRLSTPPTLFAGGSPFIELNWLHNKNRTGVSTDGENFYVAGNRDLKEVKIGLDSMKLGTNISLWGSFTHRFGKDRYRDNSVSLGISYKF